MQKTVDYLIVGAGLAGLCFANFCENNHKSFTIIEGKFPSASSVAGGMYNPVVLKRFTSIWKSKEQIDLAKEFYSQSENKVGKKYFHPLPIYRKFASIEEQNNWFIASDRASTASFLNPEILHDAIPNIPTPYAYGEVYETGFLEVEHWVNHFQKYYTDLEILYYQTFCYEDIVFDSGFWIYKDTKYKHIVFAEGFQMRNNPFFNNLPLDGTKGELLIVKIPNLNLKEIVKSKVFLMPLGDDLYKVGATYEWKDKSTVPTEEGRNILEQGLKELVQLPYEVVEHLAGIRPTVNDRRPLVGKHYEQPQMYLLNGLGTRGVLLGPYLAKALFEHIEYGSELDSEIAIERYYKKYRKQKKIPC